LDLNIAEAITGMYGSIGMAQLLCDDPIVYPKAGGARV
jgi:hypothetical protein